MHNFRRCYDIVAPFLETQKLRSSKSQNLRISEPRNLGTSESQNLRTSEPQNFLNKFLVFEVLNF